MKYKVRAAPFEPEINKRAQMRIAHGALTNSKRPECFVNGFYPTHLISGRGVKVKDVRGYEYVDYICGLGVNILGYAHTTVGDAAKDAIDKGPTLSLSTVKEVELAEKINDIFPFMEKVRFLKNGSDSCYAALRIARAFKKNNNFVLSEGYHGIGEEFVSMTPPANGIPPHPYIQPLRKDYSDEDIKAVAAVIIEPFMTDGSDERIMWLRKLRDACTKYGTVLIFDETIHALRVPKLSVASYTGITPDLMIFGKALGNGFPISVIGGRADIMDSDYFISSTFAGEMASISAGIACLKALQSSSYDINFLWAKAGAFVQRFNDMSPKVKLEGYNTRGVFVGEPLDKALFMQEACRSGLLFGPSWFYAFPHIDLDDIVFNTLQDVFFRIKSQNIKLEGALPKKPIAQQQREGIKNV